MMKKMMSLQPQEVAGDSSSFSLSFLEIFYVFTVTFD